MSEGNVLSLNGRKARWTPVMGVLPEGYPYVEDKSILWNGDTENKAVINNAWYKVSDQTFDDLTGFTVFVDENGSSTAYVLDSVTTFGGRTMFTSTLLERTLVVVVPEGNSSEAGTYFANNGSSYVSKLVIETIHPMSKEFLPEGVGGGALIVHVSLEEEQWYADTSASAVLDAAAEGKVVYALIESQNTNRARPYVAALDGSTDHTDDRAVFSLWRYNVVTDVLDRKCCILYSDEMNGKYLFSIPSV